MAAGSRSKFQQLAITHAAMMGGEAAMVVALADSFFFDVDPNAARSKVLAFLVVSFTPFLVVAPFIGPVIDRVRGGRRFVVQAVAAARIVVQLLMIRFSDDTALFALVFVALVLAKTYQISKSALVPAVVRSDRELVEANSKLGLIAGLAGVVAVVPAGLLQLTIGAPATLAYSAALFVVALVSSLRLPRELAVRPDTPSAASREALTPSVQLAWASMLILRAASGFMLFLLAFEFRGRASDGNTLLGAAILMTSLGTMAGNALAPRIRMLLHEERMVGLSLGLPALAGLAAAVAGGDRAGIALAFVVGLAAALCRLSFESIVQRDGPAANRGQAFARFETQFQFGWVAASLLPVLLPMPGRIGYLMIGAVMVAALVSYITGVRTDEAVSPRGKVNRR